MRYFSLLSLIFICLLGAAIYSNTLHSPFQFDDSFFINNNLSIRDLSNPKAVWEFWPTRFITSLTFAINYHFGRLDVFGYHLFNIIIHILSSIAVWWLAMLTLSSPAMKGSKISGYSNIIALLAGIIFVSHPIQTEGVTFMMERTVSMGALFYILSISLYAASRLSNDKIRSVSLYIMSLSVTIIAMFTRESSLTIPIAIALYEISFLKEDRGIKWQYLVPFFIIMPIIPAVMLLNLKFTKGVTSFIPLTDYIATQLRTRVTYIRLLLLPVSQRIDYNYPIYKNLFQISVLSSFALLASLFTAAILLYKRYRLIFFTIMFFFLTISVESGIINQENVIYEHRLYLPMAGFALLLSTGIFYLFRNKSPKYAIITLSILVIAYSILAYNRNAIWKDGVTLWTDVVLKSPNKARSYTNKGNAYQRRGDLDRAIADYNRSIQVDPLRAETYNNRGNAYLTKGDLGRAIPDFDKALEINPNYAAAYYNRGLAYRNKGDLDKAVSDYSKALAVKPDYANAYYSRGLAYHAKGDLDRAISDYDKTLKNDPGHAEVLYKRGLAYFSKGYFDRAIADYNKAFKIRPSSYIDYNNRGCAYKDNGNIDLAIPDFDKAISIKPDYAEAFYNRGLAYRMKGDLDRAILDFNRAIMRNPRYADAYNNRGCVFRLKGDINKAIADYDKAIEVEPGYVLAYNNRAVAHFIQKDYDKAREDVRKAEALGYKVNPDLITNLKKASRK